MGFRIWDLKKPINDGVGKRRIPMPGLIYDLTELWAAGDVVFVKPSSHQIQNPIAIWA